MRYQTLLGFLLLFVLIISAGSILTQLVLVRPAAAASNGNISGWAWGSNLGWINFKGDAGRGNYAVTFVRDLNDPMGVGGTFSHNSYAWGSNSGWINFSSDYPGPYPDADTANYHGVRVESNGSVTGWARACSVFVVGCGGSLRPLSETGGWDGWIKMSGSWANGVTYSSGTSKFSGYAWGSDVVGWIDFCGTTGGNDNYCVTLDSINPSCLADPNPAVLSGGTVSVDWNAVKPLPLIDYDFSWVWDDGTSGTGASVLGKVYTVPQRIIGTLTATGKIGTSNAGKTGRATCPVDVTNPIKKNIKINFIGNRLNQGNVSDGVAGGLNCVNGVSCSKDYDISDPPVTFNETISPPVGTTVFQGWGGGLCSGTGSCGPLTISSLGPFTTIDASFGDSTASPWSGSIGVFPPWTRILEQSAGDPANSSLVNVTVDNTSNSDFNVCLASVKSKANGSTLDNIITTATRDANDLRTSNDLPRCTFGNNTNCNLDNCINVPAGTLGKKLLLFITIPEKFYEIKANSPYNVIIEARDGTIPIGAISSPSLEFRYQVSDVFPR